MSSDKYSPALSSISPDYLIDNEIDLSLFDGSCFCIYTTNAMQNTDMAAGWVGADGSLTLFYAYATGPYGPHPRDGNVEGGTTSSGPTAIRMTLRHFTSRGEQHASCRLSFSIMLVAIVLGLFQTGIL